MFPEDTFHLFVLSVELGNEPGSLGLGGGGKLKMRGVSLAGGEWVIQKTCKGLVYYR